MFDKLIQIILALLFIFTPVVFGSVELWAFSLMELGILLIVILAAVQALFSPHSQPKTPDSELRTPNFFVPAVLLFLFCCLVLFQIVPLPSGIVKLLSPKTYSLRHALISEPSALRFQLSLFPFATRIEFLKWLTLAGIFLFSLSWKLSDRKIAKHLIPVILLVGIAESLYGIFEFFSGHGHILYLEEPISSVTGTFINRNHFAGYLLMVIPLGAGYFFSRRARMGYQGWRNRLSSLDGKSLLIAFGIILMILGLLFSASRMGISSLLFSFSLIILLFRDPERERRFSKTLVFIFGLAILWAAWIGLDAVIGRFFTSTEDFESRRRIWMNTFSIVKDFPLLGSGLGTFAQIFPLYRSFSIRGLVTHAENDFLQLASEAGLVGVGLLLALILILFYKTIRGIRHLHSESQRYVAIGGMVGILALLFHSIVERNIQVPANAFLFTFILAMVFRISQKRGEE
jgi:O-antigen ligase